MVKRKSPTAVQAYEKLLEAIKRNGNAEVAKNVKQSLDDWRELQKLFEGKHPSAKELAGKWESLQSSSSRAFQSLTTLIVTDDADSDSSTSTSSDTASKKAASSKSDSDSDDTSSDSDSDAGPSAKEEQRQKTTSGSVNGTKSESAAKTKAKMTSSSSDSSSGDESDTNTDTDIDTNSSASSAKSSASKSNLKDRSKRKKLASSSSTSSDSDSGSDSSSSSSSASSSDSDAGKKEPPIKKRKTESGNIVAKSTNAVESKTNKVLNGENLPGSISSTPTTIDTRSTSTPTTTSTPIADRNGKMGTQARKNNAPFQRIKADSVKFVDERLKDNSYHTHIGKTGDYGEKANADLIVTRGDGFRKEKNKKKRGSYRGGEISLESRSIKFT